MVRNGVGVVFVNGYGVWSLWVRDTGPSGVVYRVRMSLDDFDALGIHEYQRVQLRLPGRDQAAMYLCGAGARTRPSSGWSSGSTCGGRAAQPSGHPAKTSKRTAASCWLISKCASDDAARRGPATPSGAHPPTAGGRPARVNPARRHGGRKLSVGFRSSEIAAARL